MADVKPAKIGANGIEEFGSGDTIPAANLPSGSSGPAPAYLATDATFTSTTTLVTLFSTGSMGAGKKYAMRLGLLVSATSATPDGKFAFAYPSACEIRWGWHTNNALTGHLDAIPASGGGAANAIQIETTVGTVQISGSGSEYLFIYEGTVYNPTNAGVLTLQFAQNTSDAGTVTVHHEGSYLILTEIV